MVTPEDHNLGISVTKTPAVAEKYELGTKGDSDGDNRSQVEVFGGTVFGGGKVAS